MDALEHQARAADDIPKSLAPFFRPPPELANDYGGYASPLKFYDGKPVKSPADWPKRRREILDTWHKFMGPWPALIAKPKVEYLEKERRERVTHHHINLEVAPGQTRDAYLLLPDGVSWPRVRFEPDRIRLAFHYGRGLWATVVSIDLRVWQPVNEPNVVALELEGFHAGALPISAQSLLDQISEMLRQHNVQVTWYRHNGHPTAATKFQSDQPRPTAQLQQVELKPGMLVITGHSGDSLPFAPPPLPAAAP